MTDLKFSILGEIYSHPKRSVEFSHLIDKKFSSPLATKNAIDELIGEKLIKSIYGPNVLELTPLGANAYEEAKDIRNKDAENKKQQRFQNKISVASVLVPIVTFFLGIILEYKANIIDLFVSLFT